MFAPRYFAGRYFCRRYFPRGSNTVAVITGLVTGANRFRSATVPEFKDMAEVQRFLQRTLDEMSRAGNPIRTVADGGTGIAALDPGEILAGSNAPNSFARVKGNADTTRKVLVSLGDGVNGGIPFWDTIDSIPAGGTGTDVVIGATSVVVGALSVVTP